jgi:hypothetical protein
MSRPVPCAGSAYCGGFDLPNVGQSAECLSDSNSRGGCYNVYGGGNSCWQQVPQSKCCGNGKCSGQYSRYGPSHCACSLGWTGAKCNKRIGPPPPAPPPPPPPPSPPTTPGPGGGDEAAVTTGASAPSCTFDTEESEKTSSTTCGWTETGKNAWERGSRTPSAKTGANTAQSGKFFMFLETSNGHDGDVSYLVSPKLTTGTYAMAFFYHMYGETIGVLSAQVLHGTKWSTVWTKRGEQQSTQSASWKRAMLSLPPGTTKVRFKASKGASYTGDISLDTVSFIQTKDKASDCVGVWTACSVGGVHTFRVVKAGAHGGRNCDHADGAIESCQFSDHTPSSHQTKPGSDTSVVVRCKAGAACSQLTDFTGRKLASAAIIDKELISQTFEGIAGITYTLAVRQMASIETAPISGDASGTPADATKVSIRIAAAASLDARPRAVSQAGTKGTYQYAGTPDATIQWICPGTGSWTILLGAHCTPSAEQPSCAFGVTTAMTSRDKSVETGALTCSSPLGTPGRVCQGVEVTIAVPTPHSGGGGAELQAQMAQMFSVSAAPTAVIPTKITLGSGGKRVNVQVEMRAANADALKKLGNCLDQASTVDELQRCGEHNAISSKKVSALESPTKVCKKTVSALSGRRTLQSCSAFCSAGRPCTPPCKSWGCSNCAGGALTTGPVGHSGHHTQPSSQPPPPPAPPPRYGWTGNYGCTRYQCVRECHCGNSGSAPRCSTCNYSCKGLAKFPSRAAWQAFCVDHRDCPSCAAHGTNYQIGTPPTTQQPRGNCPANSHEAGNRLSEDLYYNGMSCECDAGFEKAPSGIACTPKPVGSAVVGRGQCQDSKPFVYSSSTYGTITCSSLPSNKEAQQECSPSSRYGLFQACPVACNSLCAINDATKITPTSVQTFVNGRMHGINAWFLFEGTAGVQYQIETHNEGKMYLYDASLMSAGSYAPKKAMIGGTEHSRLFSNVPYQQLTWTCPTSGSYAVLIAQSRFDCNNKCGRTDLSITGGSDVNALKLVPNAAPLDIATACTIDDRLATLPICHYRQITGNKDNGWLNGLGSMQYVMHLDGHAGHTYQFDFRAWSRSRINDVARNKWFTIKVPDKGGHGYNTEKMSYGGSNGVHARVTLYPPSAVGGTRGWENHVVRLGDWQRNGGKSLNDDSSYESYPGTSQGDCQAFNWTCAASGTWMVVVEANCDAMNNKHCASGFSLTTRSTDESGSKLSCSKKNGESICTGPVKQVSLETDAQMAQLFHTSKPVDALVPIHRIPPLAFAANQEGSAQLAQMFHIANPPALTVVKKVAPSAKAGHTDVTIEIRAANADVTNSISQCLHGPEVATALAGNDGESLAQMAQMFPPAHHCARLRPVKVQASAALGRQCVTTPQLNAAGRALTAACCGNRGPCSVVATCSVPCSRGLREFQSKCQAALNMHGDSQLTQLVHSAANVCSAGYGRYGGMFGGNVGPNTGGGLQGAPVPPPPRGNGH